MNDGRQKLQLSYQLSADCPQCKSEFDACDQDGEAELSHALFNNDWDKPAGFELTCPICEHEFQIAGIEH